MFTCEKIYRDIPFAHRQWRHKGHCARIHGHNWTFEFTFSSEERDGCGFVADFGDLQWLKYFIQRLDHGLVLQRDDPMLDKIDKLNVAEIVVVDDGSCEGLAKEFFEWVEMKLISIGWSKVKIVSVVVREDSRNSATYAPS